MTKFALFIIVSISIEFFFEYSDNSMNLRLTITSHVEFFYFNNTNIKYYIVDHYLTFILKEYKLNVNNKK